LFAQPLSDASVSRSVSYFRILSVAFNTETVRLIFLKSSASARGNLSMPPTKSRRSALSQRAVAFLLLSGADGAEPTL
jgi:hypothetical protein